MKLRVGNRNLDDRLFQQLVKMITEISIDVFETCSRINHPISATLTFCQYINSGIPDRNLFPTQNKNRLQGKSISPVNIHKHTPFIPIRLCIP